MSGWDGSLSVGSSLDVGWDWDGGWDWTARGQAALKRALKAASLSSF